MKKLKTRVVVAIACICCASFGYAEEKKKAKVNPSGTWRWEFDGNGNSISSALSIDGKKGGEVTGVLLANDREIEVRNGKINGDQLTFTVKFEMQSREISGVFEGKLKGDDLEGSIEFRTDDGSQEFPWKAKRTVEISDLVGNWNIKIDSPEGELTSKVAVSKEDGKPKVVVTSQDGSETVATNVKIEKNLLHYDLKLDFNGSELELQVKGRPYGSRITGTIEYSVNGDSGELTFEGQREKSNKKS